MSNKSLTPDTPVRVLHSFPHRLGKSRIATTAWYEIDTAATAGSEIIVFAGDSVRPFANSKIKVHTTFSRGKLRLPYRLLGTPRMCKLHDWLVARQLPLLQTKIDVIHVWPLAARRTLETARRLKIPTLLERPNAHTRFAYQVVKEECEKLGVSMPAGHEHAYNEGFLRHEEREYSLADRLLCPSDFVVRTFIEQGFKQDQLARHQYGFDEKVFFPSKRPTPDTGGLKMLYVGGCAPRKGLHYALEAWLASSAHREGIFSIAGAFISGYAEKLSTMLSHPSVRVLGHRTDVPELMRENDLFVLSSIEEGSALVTSEARGSGCVLLVSDATGAICEHGVNALVHPSRDPHMLRDHIDLLESDRAFLKRMRAASLATIDQITWKAAGRRLYAIYSDPLRT
jgi:glycosyltransferase involved in cell wall biosynthesis